MFTPIKKIPYCKLSGKIFSTILVTVIAVTSAVSVASASTQVTVHDGSRVQQFLTLLNREDVPGILKQADIELSTNDSVTVEALSPSHVEIQVDRAVTVSLTTETGTNEFFTSPSTVGDFLQNLGIAVDERLWTSVPLDTPLEENMAITALRLVEISLTCDGETHEILVLPGTVESVLAKAEVALGEHDIVNEPLDKRIEDGMEISVTRVSFAEEEGNEKIPFGTATKNDDSMPRGQKVVEREGKDGEKRVKKMVRYENGEVVGAEVLEETVTREPVEQILVVGTKKIQKTPNGTIVCLENGTVTDSNGTSFRYSKSISGTCTAYSSKDGTHTSTGATAREGTTVAVDPRVIPYGSRVYIEGIGVRRAQDTGGAMRQGHATCDIYFTNESDARHFGRKKNVKIYIIED